MTKRIKRKRGPVPATPDELERAALDYLNRFDATAHKLRTVLLRRVRRSADVHGTDPEEGRRTIERLVDRYQQSGLVSDVRYAATMAHSLRARGASLRAIRYKLGARGVSDDDVSAALTSEGISEDDELDAARELARRRRLGPFRDRADRARHARKDYAALARAGFRREVVERILGPLVIAPSERGTLDGGSRSSLDDIDPEEPT